MNSSNQCCICHKEPGAIFCIGCKSHFCMKDLKSHRQQLSTELDAISDERDGLQDRINQGIEQPDSSNPIIRQINEWQKTMNKKVDEIAEQARQQAIKVLETKRIQIVDEFKLFSEELKQRKESENFVEYDLIQFKLMLQQFDQELQRLLAASIIELHTESSELIQWERMIYIEVKPNKSIFPQAQQQEKQQFDIEPPQKVLHQCRFLARRR